MAASNATTEILKNWKRKPTKYSIHEALAGMYGRFSKPGYGPEYKDKLREGDHNNNYCK